jgi:hypothetical protein
LSCILHAVKCHAASSERKTVAKLRPMYAIFSNINRYMQIDRYNIIYILAKRLIGIIPLLLIYDSTFSTKDVTIITGVKD